MKIVCAAFSQSSQPALSTGFKKRPGSCYFLSHTHLKKILTLQAECVHSLLWTQLAYMSGCMPALYNFTLHIFWLFFFFFFHFKTFINTFVQYILIIFSLPHSSQTSPSPYPFNFILSQTNNRKPAIVTESTLKIMETILCWSSSWVWGLP